MIHQILHHAHRILHHKQKLDLLQIAPNEHIEILAWLIFASILSRKLEDKDFEG